MIQTDFLTKQIGSLTRDGIEVLQLDNSDCGLACLVSIHAFYGGRITVSEIRFFMDTEIEGTSMSALARAAEQLGYQAQGIKANKVHLSQMNKPFIAHIQKGENGHYVVVYAVNSKSVQLMDPSSGRLKRIRLSIFLNQWTGYLLHFDPPIKSGKSSEGSIKVHANQSSYQLDLKEHNFSWFKWINLGLLILGGIGLFLFVEVFQSSVNWIVGLILLFAIDGLVGGFQMQFLKDLRRKEQIWMKDVIRIMIRIRPLFF